MSVNKKPYELSGREKRFEISGRMSVSGKPLYDVEGNNVGFELKDGTIVKLVIALEVQIPKWDIPTYITKTEEMSKLGFDLISYYNTQFTD